MNIKRLEAIRLESMAPFNDRCKQVECSIKEVTNHLDQVMEHYGLFLNEGDFEDGRIRQFTISNMEQALEYQREITRLSWIRTKYFRYGSDEAVYFWRRHRIEFEILGEMLNDKINL